MIQVSGRAENPIGERVPKVPARKRIDKNVGQPLGATYASNVRGKLLLSGRQIGKSASTGSDAPIIREDKNQCPVKARGRQEEPYEIVADRPWRPLEAPPPVQTGDGLTLLVYLLGSGHKRESARNPKEAARQN